MSDTTTPEATEAAYLNVVRTLLGRDNTGTRQRLADLPASIDPTSPQCSDDDVVVFARDYDLPDGIANTVFVHDFYALYEAVGDDAWQRRTSTDPVCDVCDEPFTLHDDGTTTHDSDDTIDGIDHDADADHVPHMRDGA